MISYICRVACPPLRVARFRPPAADRIFARVCSFHCLCKSKTYVLFMDAKMKVQPRLPTQSDCRVRGDTARTTAQSSLCRLCGRMTPAHTSPTHKRHTVLRMRESLSCVTHEDENHSKNTSLGPGHLSCEDRECECVPPVIPQRSKPQRCRTLFADFV